MLTPVMATKRKPVVKARKPAQERSRETVKAIIQAAERILADGGQEAFTTSRVAKLAGVSKGTLYEYFRTTKDVLRAVEEYSWSRVMAQIAEVIQGPPPPTPEEGISRMILASMSAIEHRASVHGFTLEVEGDEGARWGLIHGLATVGAARLQARVPAERLRPKDPQLAAEIITCIVPFLTWLELTGLPKRQDSVAFRAAVVSLVQSFFLRDSAPS